MAELQTLADLSKKLKGSRSGPAIHTAAFRLIKVSIAFAEEAVSDEKDIPTLQTLLNKVRKAYNQSATVLDRTDR